MGNTARPRADTIPILDRNLARAKIYAMAQPELELPGESALSALWLEFADRAVTLADECALSEDNLRGLHARYQAQQGAFAAGLTALIEAVVHQRRMQQIAAHLPPGTTLTSLVGKVRRPP